MRITDIFVAAALAALPAFAVQTKTWSQGDQADYEKAVLKGLSLRSDGQLSLAPAVKELFDPALPYLWAAAHDSKGNLYVAGSGPGGSTVKVFRVDAAGKSSALAEIEGLEIHALAVDSQDRVYAATAPDGKIWRIGSDSKPQVFYDPKAKYIWAMAFSSAGDLFVATGDQGEVHRIASTGKGTVFFRLEDAHARSLAIDAKGNVIVGTEPSGLVIRISPAGEGFVLYQTSKREVTAVAVAAGGRIYASAVGNKGGSQIPLTIPPPPASTSQPPGGPNPMAPARTAPAPAVPTLGPGVSVAGGSEIIEIDTDGAPHKLWSHAQEIVYALGFDPAGKLLAGTGNKGGVYRIDSPSLYTLLAASTSSQITGFCNGRNGAVFAVTGNVAKVLQIGPNLETQGSLESDVYDAGIFSFWGRLNDSSTLDGGAIRFETRSGNLDRPQKSWSTWSVLKDGRITSPAARFLQWRATLTPSPAGKSPELTGVDIALLAKNVAPRVEEVEPTPANYKFPQPSSPASSPQTLNLQPMGRKSRPATNLSVDTGGSSPSLSYGKGSAGGRWLAADDNGDALIFKVEIRGASETTWKLLKDKVREKYLSFDSTAFPDGEYVLRVTASDAPDNPPEHALTGEAVSGAFLIDNTAPAIDELSAQPAGGRVQVRFKAKDALNWISKAEYSINGVEWLVVEPVSKLSDSRELEYNLLLDRPAPGELTIAVRVTDEFDNQAVSKVVVK